MPMPITTSDLCDHVPGARAWVAPWRCFGGRTTLSGRIATVRTFEDAALIREMLGRYGENRVLVVDAGGSLRHAVLGDRMARLGADNGWAGVVIHGAVRDTLALQAMEFGVFALGCVPLRGRSEGQGACEVELTLGGLVLRPGEFVTADGDGIVITTDVPAIRA